jgi:pimeloyl-ACP methyl ester carboxylesterase
VYAPTLTGLGERSHLLSPAIDLETHVRDVTGVLKYEELTGVVLVGHSYGGMVITGVAEAVAPRLAHLVYLDAFLPRDGECLMDLFSPRAREATLQRARDQGEGWYSPPREEDQPFGVTDPADARWVRSKLSAHPVKTWLQPVRLADPVAAALPRTYASCTGTRWFTVHAERARAESGWRHREIPTGHDAMITAPRELAVVLLEVVAGGAAR